MVTRIAMPARTGRFVLSRRQFGTLVDLKHLLLHGYVLLYLLFVIAPLVVVVGVSFEKQPLLRFPPQQLSLRWYREVLSNDAFVSAARNSLEIAVIATVGALVLGAPAAYGITRYRFPGRDAVGLLLLSPLIVPQLAVGIALLQSFAYLGIAGSILTLALGHILITLPYVVRTIAASVAGLDPSLEEAAANLGAGRLQVYLRVVFPLVRSSLYAAAMFAFLISFDNAVISLFLVSARTTTLPIAIYAYVENSLDPAIAALASLLMLVSLVVLAVAQRLGNLERVDT